MKKIPFDFTYSKYGLTCRLVREEDAAFILQLRSDPKLSKYVHKIDNDLQGQIDWIREYKKREIRGEDYYFIYFSKNGPIGVNRIYNITETSSTSGSWICKKDSLIEESLATSFILGEIMSLFEIHSGPFNVSRGNNHVLKFHLSMGAEVIGENEFEYTMRYNSEKYKLAKDKYIRLFNLKNETK